MQQLLNYFSGKLRAKAVLSLLHLTRLALFASAALLSATAQAQTYKAVTLDGGGYTSGFTQADDGRIYAYGDVFGAWRTDDKGKNWSYLNWSIPGDGAIYGHGMAVQKNNADVVFYLTGSALYKSTNGGTTWEKVLAELGTGPVGGGDNAPRVRATSPVMIRSDRTEEIWYAGPRKGLTGWLWKSSNGGKDWTKVSATTFDTEKTMTLHHNAAFPDQIWVGTEAGIYVTTDGGGSFRKVSSHPNVTMIQRFTTGPDAGVLLFTRGGVNNDGGGVSRVTATNYNDVTTYSAAQSATQNLYFGHPSGLQIFSDNTAAAWNTQGDRQGYSTDGGRTFIVRPTTLNTTHVPVWTTAAIMDAKDHPDYGTDQVIQVGNDPNHWMITGGGAAMESFDKGLSWSYLPNGTGIAAVKAYTVNVSRHDENRLYIPASDIGGVIITDGGASGSAERSTTKTNAYLHSAFRVLEGPDLNNLVFAGVHQGDNRNILLKSGDGGINWTETIPGNLPASYDGITKSVMSLNNANDFLVVLGERNSPARRVYRTTNGGASFNAVADLPDNLVTGHRYDPMTAFIERDATQADVRYFVARGTSFYKSTNGGTNWTPTAKHPFDGNAWVWGLVADPVRSGNLWAAGDWAGVRYTTDGGTSWNSTTPYFNARHVSSCDGKIAIWGQKDGESAARLWYSPDNGANWYAQSTFARNFHGVQGVTVDRKGKIWVSWNSVTVVTPVTGTPVADTQKPTAPAGLASESVTSSSFTLKWTAATDNVGVTGYEVFRDGTSLGTTTSLSYNVTGLAASTAYSMTVRARDAAGNVSDPGTALSVTTAAAVTLRNADNPASTLAGLDYRYYEGTWSVLPNFDALTVAKQGTVTNFDLTPRNRNDNFAFRFTGYVNVPSDGTYTFYTSSDDGSKLYIGTAEVVNNDGLHGLIEKSGTIGLKAGRHAITVAFFEGGGGESLLVSYSGPGVSKQAIPASALSRSITGNFGFENDFTGWSAYGTASVNTTAANVRSGSKSGYFSNGGANYELTGLTPGATYVVKAWVKAVGGSDVWITAAGEGGSQVGQQMTSTSWTQSGNIVIRMGATATKARISAWTGATSSAYFDDFTIEPCSSCRTASADNSQPGPGLTLQLHPNPASRQVSISLAGFEGESTVQLKLSDLAGKAYLRRQVQPGLPGKQVTLSVGHLPQGIFLVSVQGSKTAKTARLVITR
jgi:hypothetical protein